MPVQADPLSPERWTRVQLASLKSSGVFAQEKLELIEGELLNKLGRKRPHVNAVTLLHGLLVEIFGLRRVNVEAPIDVAPEDNPTSEPEPDLIVLNRDLAHFASTNPKPGDLALVVEVSDTTLAFDLITKAALYARAAIVEYWVLDVTTSRLIVHREPIAGRYTSIAAYAEDERIAPLGAGDSAIRIGDCFAV